MTDTTTETKTRLYTAEYVCGTMHLTRTVTVRAACLRDAIEIVQCDHDALTVLEVHCEGVRLY